jgi:acyl-CoA reductase-like NAD-dependent aldehyde dehydrogenase
LVATPFEDFDEVIRMANDTSYGLGAGVYTSNIDRAHAAATALQAGNIWVNCYGVLNPNLPFGGFKESGTGREMGDEGLEAFLETKSVYISLKDPRNTDSNTLGH